MYCCVCFVVVIDVENYDCCDEVGKVCDIDGWYEGFVVGVDIVCIECCCCCVELVGGEDLVEDDIGLFVVKIGNC